MNHNSTLIEETETQQMNDDRVVADFELRQWHNSCGSRPGLILILANFHKIIKVYEYDDCSIQYYGVNSVTMRSSSVSKI